MLSVKQRGRVTMHLKPFNIVSSGFSPISLRVIVRVKFVLRSDVFWCLLGSLYFWKDFPEHSLLG